jgi:hypothetical protein
MCGRFTLLSSPEAVQEQFELENEPALLPRYNVAPSQDVAAVRFVADSNARECGSLRWGPGVRGAPGGVCALSPRRRRGRERVCRRWRQVIGRSSGRKNHCRRPFAGGSINRRTRVRGPGRRSPGKDRLKAAS